MEMTRILKKEFAPCKKCGGNVIIGSFGDGLDCYCIKCHKKAPNGLMDITDPFIETENYTKESKNDIIDNKFSLNELAQKTYNRAIERGKITTSHTWDMFMSDLYSETRELEEARTDAEIKPEIADCIFVLTSIAVRHGWDIEELLREKADFNEKRKD